MSKILVIDDNVDNLLVVTDIIADFFSDCQVQTAGSGKEGIELAKSDNPDVIILDVYMPEMDGFETCQLLKSNMHTKNIPIILLTAIQKDPKSFARGLSLGADAFLKKPIDDEELTAQIKVALRIKQAEDQLKNYQEKLQLEVKETRNLYKDFFNHVNDVIIIHDFNSTILEVNNKTCHQLGWNKEYLIGKKITEFTNKSFSDKYNSIISLLSISNNIIHESELIDINHEKIPVEINSIIFQYKNQKAVLCSMRDISERKFQEKKLIDTLNEKELLLKEIHHRVKNNLQNISSLLNLQVNFSQDSNSNNILRDTASRIQSMGLIHEMLYQTNNSTLLS